MRLASIYPWTFAAIHISSPQFLLPLGSHEMTTQRLDAHGGQLLELLSIPHLSNSLQGLAVGSRSRVYAVCNYICLQLQSSHM